MEDVALFAVVAAFHLGLAFVWVGVDDVTFLGSGPGRAGVRVGPDLPVRERGGFVVSGVVPPLARAYRASRPSDWRARGCSEAAFSEQQVRERVAAFDTWTWWIEGAEAALWAYLFVMAPLVVYARGLASTWPYLLAVLAGLDGLIAILLFRAHRTLYPEKPGDAWMKSVVALVSPLDAVRSRDYLARDLLVSFHPIAVAAELCDEAAFTAFARAARFDLARAAALSQTDARAADRDRQDLADVERLLSRRSMLQAVTGAPARQDPESLAFCPRCGVEYHRSDGLCADCDRVSLQLFA